MTEILDLQATEVALPAARVVRAPFACKPDRIGEEAGKAFNVIDWFMNAHHLIRAGAPSIVYEEYGPSGVKADALQPIVDDGASPASTRLVYLARLPARRALRFIHRGPCRRLGETYDRIGRYLVERGFADAGQPLATPMWEEYLSDLATTPPAELLTHVFVPLR